ncbi:MAG: tRNA-dihydrouridine synthase family protein [Vicinamibacterales bacterium]
MIDLASALAGAVVMAPMTKGSNLPYRQLAVELGARVLVSEMAVARRLKQRRRGEFALIRRFEGEPCFGVQLAGNSPDEMAWAAALVASRGADFVDVNLGCPIDQFTRKGLGAALGRQPQRVKRIVEAMRQAIDPVPVTVKIRLGWDDEHLNYLSLAQAAVDGGASAIFVHGRTRDARYRYAANWDAIGEVASVVPVPVVGNGDILFPRDVDAARARSQCAGVMTARGALIKPWLFREAAQGAYEDISAEGRLALYERYVALAKRHWGEDDHGLTRVRDFTRWHMTFWCRYRPAHPDGTFPSMQERDGPFDARSPLDALLARTDALAHDYITECLVAGRSVEPDRVPPSPQSVDRDEASLPVNG